MLDGAVLKADVGPGAGIAAGVSAYLDIRLLDGAVGRRAVPCRFRFPEKPLPGGGAVR